MPTGQPALKPSQVAAADAPAYYLMFGAAVGLLAAVFLTERAGGTGLFVADPVEATAA